MDSNTKEVVSEIEARKIEQQNRLNAIEQLDDEGFLKELRKLHGEFILYVCETLAKGRLHRDTYFHRIASQLAEARDYIFLCDRIYIPVRFQERLMKILNAEQQKFNQFDNVKEQIEQQETKPAEASQG